MPRRDATNRVAPCRRRGEQSWPAVTGVRLIVGQSLRHEQVRDPLDALPCHPDLARGVDHVTAAFGSFAVDDIEVAREVYGRTLGLAVTEAAPGGSSPLWIQAGDGPAVFVYAKPEPRSGDSEHAENPY